MVRASLPVARCNRTRALPCWREQQDPFVGKRLATHERPED